MKFGSGNGTEHFVNAIMDQGDLIERHEVDFDLLDRKGRKIGYRWNLHHLTISLYDEATMKGKRGYYREHSSALSHNVIAWFSVTRNGADYGPGFNRDHYDSIEAANAAMHAKAEQARKRYARKPQEKR
jgi:hypothetical protein